MKFLNSILFPKFYWWLLLLLPLTLLGFFPTYFGKLPGALPTVFHLHAAFMLIWIAIAISQPFLIKWKKTGTHRRIGQISYFVMPLVIFTGYLIIRFGYNRSIERLHAAVDRGESSLSPAAIADISAQNSMIGIVYLVWLALFYLLAVRWRKKIIPHSTYMFAAMLTLLGPTVDRIIFQVYQYYGIGFNLFAETAVFVLIDLLLLLVAWYQWKRGKALRPVLTALTIYVFGQGAYFLLPRIEMWNRFVSLIM